MRDAVAEVLSARARIGRGVGVTLGISLALHLALFAAVLLSARATSTLAPVEVLNIRFAPATPAPATPAPPVQVATPAPPVETPKPEPKAPPKKEPYAPKKESIFGRSDRPLAPPAKAPTELPSPAGSEPAAAAAEPAGAALPQIGTAGVTGFEGGEFPYTIYVDRMLVRIGENWFRPSAAGEPLARVYFVIERDGTVRDVNIEQPSGNAGFDRAALRAVRDSSPLPPLPFGYRGTWLGVHLTFH